MANYMTCKGINLFFDNNPTVNLLTVEYDKKYRTFCRCGEVFSKKVYNCPTCGKSGLRWYSCDYYHSEIYHTYRIDKTPKGFDIYKLCYNLKPNKITEEFEIVLDIEEIITSKDSSGLNLDLKSYRYSSCLGELPKLDLEEIKKIDSTFFEGFKTFDFKDFFSENYIRNEVENNTFSKYVLYCYFRNQIPWLFDKEKCLNSSLFVYFYNNLNEIAKHRSYKNFISYYNLGEFEKFLDTNWFFKGQCYLRNLPVNKFNKLDKSYKEPLLYYLEHYKISYVDFNSICEQLYDAIKYAKIEPLDDKVFIKYLKDNLIVCKRNIIEAYTDDLDLLTRLKLGKTNDNLRNINFLKNQETLTQNGYPEKKINIFMDSFYDNPLKASYYLKSKKELTKKEIEAFIESQTK